MVQSFKMCIPIVQQMSEATLISTETKIKLYRLKRRAWVHSITCRVQLESIFASLNTPRAKQCCLLTSQRRIPKIARILKIGAVKISGLDAFWSLN